MNINPTHGRVEGEDARSSICLGTRLVRSRFVSWATLKLVRVRTAFVVSCGSYIARVLVSAL